MEELDEYLLAILRDVGSGNIRNPDQRLTAFLPLRGMKYRNDLMVVGRALNGWVADEASGNLSEQASCRHLVERTRKESILDKPDGPMSWVTEQWSPPDRKVYNTARSAFWRVVRRFGADSGMFDEHTPDWSSTLAYSNLYKVAPSSGGNPSDSLCAKQLAGCISMFRRELEILRPTKLLLLTGWSWAEPFLDCADMVTSPGRLVDCVGRLKLEHQTTHVVVARHPQAKPEAEWVSEAKSGFESVC